MQTLIRLQAVAALLVCFGIMAIFGVRLHTIAQMRGMMPGIRIINYQVTQKWVNSGTRRRGPSYWVGWGPRDRLASSDNSVMLEQARWQRLRIGDQVRIARGSIERTPYEVHGNFASDGSLISYSLFVCGAFAWAVWMCYVIVTVKPKPKRPWERD